MDSCKSLPSDNPNEFDVEKWKLYLDHLDWMSALSRKGPAVCSALVKASAQKIPSELAIKELYDWYEKKYPGLVTMEDLERLGESAYNYQKKNAYRPGTGRRKS